MTPPVDASPFRSPLAHLTPEFAAEDHPVWLEIAPRAGRPGFMPSEFDRPDELDAHWLRLLYAVRTDLWAATRAAGLPDVPMRIISDARSEDAGASRSAHGAAYRPCRAVDLQVYTAHERGVITVCAARRGIVRIGIYPGERASDAWRDKAGMHLDASAHPHHPSPALWTRF